MDNNVGDLGMAAQSSANSIINAQNIVCDKCGSKIFVPAYVLKQVSKLVSPSGRDEVIEIPLFVCSKCGEIAPHYKSNSNFAKILGEEEPKIKL